MQSYSHTFKPDWLKLRLPLQADYEKVKELLRRSRLHTVCQAAQCPNIWECFSKNTATFMILGKRCTRSCGFCALKKQPHDPPDPDEPSRVAKASSELKLKYVVITSVTRDDLSDGGAEHFARTIEEIRCRLPQTLIEVLIPDFQGDRSALQTVLAARPDVLNHNIETVERLYPTVRPQADYFRSLRLIQHVHEYAPQIPIKSGFMLGLGETADEILTVLKDLRSAYCHMVTIGQYLQPLRIDTT